MRFELALALGVPHPDMLDDLLTAEQMADWEAFFRVRPFGEFAADWRAGMVASVLATMFGKKKYKPQDFMLFRPPRSRPTPGRILSALRWASMLSREREG